MRRLFARKRDKPPCTEPPPPPEKTPEPRKKGVVFASEVPSRTPTPNDPSVAFPSYSVPSVQSPSPEPDLRSSHLHPRAASPTSVASGTSPHQSLTRVAHENTTQSSSSQLLQPITWSEMADDDLVGNLGGRERTRQEVLWEMVCSEERYVAELRSLKECYVEPLLNALSFQGRPQPPSQARSPPLHSSVQSESVPDRRVESTSPDPSYTDQIEHLPVAARFINGDRRSSFLSYPPPQGSDTTHNTRTDSTPCLPEIFFDPSSPYRESSSAAMRLSARSQQSMPKHTDFVNFSEHPRTSRATSPTNHRSVQPTAKEAPQFKHYLKTLAPPPPKKLHKPKSAVTLSASPSGQVQIPESLRIVLEVIRDGLLEGHQVLSVGLRSRYDEQYPLVRSLTDVWANQDWIVKHYATYVLHLERALQDIEYALAQARPNPARTKDRTGEGRRLTRLIIKLEEQASAAGESGLAICLSKPFMRLLKYPLLFQSLLYYSDPASPEYESTKSMAVEIGTIVRSIESEKISYEEREVVRDVWSRIDGIVDKELMMPRSDRTLVSEEMLKDSSPAADGRRTISDVNTAKSPDASGRLAVPPHAGKQARGQKSFRRLSDFVNQEKKVPVGSKKDIWLVKLSDVTLRCQRIGITTLPLGLVEAGNQAEKTAPKDRKRSTADTPNRFARNMYRFICVEERMSSPNRNPESGDSLSSSVTSAAESDLGARPLTLYDSGNSISNIQPHDDQQDNAPLENGGPSRMSFSYKSDELLPNLPIAATANKNDSSERGAQPGNSPNNGVSPRVGEIIAREGNAAAKFSNRLRPTSIENERVSSSASQTRNSRFDEPTAASLARVTSPRPISPSPHYQPASSRPPSRLVGSADVNQPHWQHLTSSSNNTNGNRPRASSHESTSNLNKPTAAKDDFLKPERIVSVAPAPLPRWI